MTYKRLKSLTRALLIGDVTLTKDSDEMLALLEYAYDAVANEADALKLFTESDEAKILRQGPGKIFVRKPNLPEYDEDELDIDDELSYAVSRYIASFVSREKMEFHENKAEKIIRAYNQKVQVFFENMMQDEELQDFDKYDKFGRREYP